MTDKPDARRRRGRVILFAVAAVFVLPLALAWFLFGRVDELPPDAVTANGTLIEPARPLGGFTLAGAAGDAPLTAAALDGRWTLLQVDGAECGDACREMLWESRQVHTRLGRDATRVQRVLLVVGDDAALDTAFLAREHPGLASARIDAADPWLQTLTVDGAPPQGRLFVIDPLGNLMMYYERAATPRGLLDDLKRLLRLSRIG